MPRCLLFVLLFTLPACGGPPDPLLPEAVAWTTEIDSPYDRIRRGRSDLSVADLREAVQPGPDYEQLEGWREVEAGRWLLLLGGRPGGPAADIAHASVVVQDLGTHRTVSLLLRRATSR